MELNVSSTIVRSLRRSPRRSSVKTTTDSVQTLRKFSMTTATGGQPHRSIARIYKFDESYLQKRTLSSLTKSHQTFCASSTHDGCFPVTKAKSRSSVIPKVCCAETLAKKGRKNHKNVATSDDLSQKSSKQTGIPGETHVKVVAESPVKPMLAKDSKMKGHSDKGLKTPLPITIKDEFSDMLNIGKQSPENLRSLEIVKTTVMKRKTSLSETSFLKDSPSKRPRKYDHKEKRSEPSCSGRNLKSAAALDASNNSKQSIKEKNLKELYLGLPVKKISGENLDCDYIQLLDKKSADTLYQKCEKEIEYFTGDLAKVRVFGKWFDVPRKQVAYGDAGLTYAYSGNKVPARPWPPFLQDLRDQLKSVTGAYFSFVLVNRYADGDDYMGEHKDDEKDLNKLSPIASISLGQTREFKFRHGDARGKNAKRKIEPVSVDLKHGTLLMMNYPTNQYWYHSLPKRKAVKFPRINLTFRDIKK